MAAAPTWTQVAVKKKPCHSCQQNVQLTWSSLLLPNAYLPPPLDIPRSSLFPQHISKAGLWKSYLNSLPPLLVWFPVLTYLSWKFALLIRRHSKTSSLLLSPASTLQHNLFCLLVLPPSMFLLN